MKTRKANVADISAVAKLFSLYRIFYSQTQDVHGAEKFISARIQNEDSVIFVAEDEENVIIGFAQLYPTFSSVSMKRLWILNDLFVEKESRGKKGAKLLLDECLSFAKSTEAKGLTLKTSKDNIIAQKLYEKNGWKLDSQYVSYNISS